MEEAAKNRTGERHGKPGGSPAGPGDGVETVADDRKERVCLWRMCSSRTGVRTPIGRIALVALAAEGGQGMALVLKNAD